MHLQVKDFMSTSVITAEGKNSVGEIRSLMKHNGIHAIPIVGTAEPSSNDEIPIRGIITATDLSNEMDDNLLVEEVMTFARVYVIPMNTRAKSAATMMLKHNVHHIVVMEDGKIVGMISSLDFVKLVAAHTLDIKTDTVL